MTRPDIPMHGRECVRDPKGMSQMEEWVAKKPRSKKILSKDARFCAMVKIARFSTWREPSVVLEGSVHI